MCFWLAGGALCLVVVIAIAGLIALSVRVNRMGPSSIEDSPP